MSSLDPDELREPEREQDRQPKGLLGAVGDFLGGVAPAKLPLRGWPAALASLGYPAFRLVWLGACFSAIGMWMQNIAQAWLIYDLTHSEFWLGLEAFATSVPVVLLLPMGGVLADRYSRRVLLIITNLAQMLLAVLLMALAGTHVIAAWHMVAISFCHGIAAAVAIPAMQSLLPSLVPRANLGNAIALNSAQFNASRAIGPALGGVVLVNWGAAWSFGYNAVTFLPLIAVLLFMPLPISAAAAAEAPDDGEGSKSQSSGGTRAMMWRGLVDGVGYLRQRRDILIMLLTIVLTGLCVAPVMSMMPALVRDGLHGSASDFSMLLSAFGVGAMIGAVMIAARSDRTTSPWRAFPILLTMGLALFTIAWSRSLWLTAAAVGVAGVSFTGTMVRLFTTILRSTPDAFRGRLSSVQVLSFRLGLPLGSMAAGIIAEQLGITAAFLAAGVAVCLGVPGLALLARRHGMCKLAAAQATHRLD
jgi:MFS family permease